MFYICFRYKQHYRGQFEVIYKNNYTPISFFLDFLSKYVTLLYSRILEEKSLNEYMITQVY